MTKIAAELGNGVANKRNIASAVTGSGRVSGEVGRSKIPLTIHPILSISATYKA